MEGFNRFAHEVISGLRPVLDNETLDHVSFAIEDGQMQQAVIEAVGGAVKQQVLMPVRVVDMVRDRLTDGESFRSRDAKKLKRLLQQAHTEAAPALRDC
ncbi:MAG: hypothetical protein WAW17_28830 [Rhodococcus sp. (in: high G+C Gram-positive bacteria)]|uniref:hypothetical protein n=1 Tax=Rhodococcus sp. TaxID=1831 RepID=UPI003BB21657